MNNTRAHSLSLSPSHSTSRFLTSRLSRSMTLSLSLSPHHVYLFTRARTWVYACTYVYVCLRVCTHTWGKRVRIYKAITCTAVSIIARIQHEYACVMWPPFKNWKLPISHHKLFPLLPPSKTTYLLIRQMRSGHLEKNSPSYRTNKNCVRLGRMRRYFIRREFSPPRIYVYVHMYVYACVFPVGPFFCPMLPFLQ